MVRSRTKSSSAVAEKVEYIQELGSQVTERAPLQLLENAQGISPVQEAKNAPLFTDWSSLENAPADINERVYELTQRLRMSYTRSLMAAVEMGRILSEAREYFNATVGESFWDRWLMEEINRWYGEPLFSSETAINYINVYNLLQKHPTLQELKLNMRVLYQLGRSNMPESVVKTVIAEAKSGKNVKLSDVKRLQKEKTPPLSSSFNLEPDVARWVNSLHIGSKSDELRRLEKMRPEKQHKVLRVISENPKQKLSVRQASRLIRNQELQLELVSAIPTQSAVVEPELKPTDWRTMLLQVQAETIDMMVCEPPLSRSWLPNYADLFQHMERILKPGGRALMVAGQQNCAFIGQYLNMAPSLDIGWLYVLWTRPGDSKRVVGINAMVTYTPVFFVYKKPFLNPEQMMADMVYHDGTGERLTGSALPHEVKRTIRHVQTGELDVVTEKHVPKFHCMEDCLQYYAEILTRPTDEVLYLCPEPIKGNVLEPAVRMAAEVKRASRYLSIHGR